MQGAGCRVQGAGCSYQIVLEGCAGEKEFPATADLHELLVSLAGHVLQHVSLIEDDIVEFHLLEEHPVLRAAEMVLQVTEYILNYLEMTML